MADVRLTATNPDDSTVVPVACNAKGELKLEEPPEFDGTFDGDLTVTGSGEFESSLTSKYSGKGTVQTAGSISYGIMVKDTVGAFSATVGWDGSATFAGGVAAAGSVLVGEPTSTTTNTSGAALSQSGLVTASVLNVDDINTQGAGSNAFVAVAPNGVDPTKKKPVFRVANSGSVYIGNQTGSNLKDTKIVLDSTGSATFEGEVVVGSRGQKWTLVEQGGLCHMVAATRSDPAFGVVDPAFGVVDPADAEYPELRDVFKELDMIESALQEVMERLRMAPPSGWEVWDGSDT